MNKKLVPHDYEGEIEEIPSRHAHMLSNKNLSGLTRFFSKKYMEKAARTAHTTCTFVQKALSSIFSDSFIDNNKEA